MPTFVARSSMPVPSRELFAWHERAGAFERLAPAWETMSIRLAQGGIRDGGRLHFAVHKGPLRLPWHALHSGYIEGEQFVDTQERGPFARWQHTHHCLPDPVDPTRSVLEDHIEYALPLGSLGRAFGGAHIRRLLERMFITRHQRTRLDLLRHASFAGPPPRVLLAGASGAIGRELAAYLSTGGCVVTRLVRRAPAAPDERRWNPADATLDPRVLDDIDAVINLCGSPILRRWTDANKRDILHSRVTAAATLARALAAHPRREQITLLQASGSGIYPASRVPLDESAPLDSSPSSFPAAVAQQWECATEPASDAGVRVVHLRIGAALSTRGGLLAGVLPAARFGLLGPLGPGTQLLSWIAMDDLIGAIEHAMRTPCLHGSLNCVAPEPISNTDFTRALAGVLHRPVFPRVPARLLHVLIGELASEALRDNAVRPARLLDSGFVFRHPSIGRALRTELGLPADHEGIEITHAP